MPKSSKLHANLKAADRRRRRRKLSDRGPGAELKPSEATPPRPVGVDAPRLLIEATLVVADRDDQLNDSAVIGALRAIKNQTTSRSSFTQGVTEEMIARLDAAGVSPSDRRTAATELLAIAVQNVDPESPQALIRYLELIAS